MFAILLNRHLKFDSRARSLRTDYKGVMVQLCVFQDVALIPVEEK